MGKPEIKPSDFISFSANWQRPLLKWCPQQGESNCLSSAGHNFDRLWGQRTISWLCSSATPKLSWCSHTTGPVLHLIQLEEVPGHSTAAQKANGYISPLLRVKPQPPLKSFSDACQAFSRHRSGKSRIGKGVMLLPVLPITPHSWASSPFPHPKAPPPHLQNTLPPPLLAPCAAQHNLTWVGPCRDGIWNWQAGTSLHAGLAFSWVFIYLFWRI